MMIIDLEALLAPIPGDNPAGQDMSDSLELDEIKEARRSEDPDLNQGEWKREVKTAQWPRVKELAVQLLTQKSKNLEVACWLSEALAQLHQFEGVHAGLELIRNLLTNYWDTLYPNIVDNDLDLRIGRVAWLNTYLPPVIHAIPLTAQATGGYGWQRWQESREVENLGRQNPEAMQQAIDEGKLSAAAFDKAVRETPAGFYRELYDAISRCRQSASDLEKTVDERFGRDAPSLAQIRQAIQDCFNLVERTAKEKGVFAPKDETTPGSMEAEGEEVGAGAQIAARPSTTGPIQNRQEALRRLAEVAMYFRQNEPTSPVSYLLDRAVKWGNMTLDQWLHEMIKEGWTLDTLLGLLGIKPGTPAE
jgi:type VI secretion system protein ImpA